jgi:hypothetical protein
VGLHPEAVDKTQIKESRPIDKLEKKNMPLSFYSKKITNELKNIHQGLML